MASVPSIALTAVELGSKLHIDIDDIPDGDNGIYQCKYIYIYI
jgi:hypothetical protein